MLRLKRKAILVYHVVVSGAQSVQYVLESLYRPLLIDRAAEELAYGHLGGHIVL